MKNANKFKPGDIIKATVSMCCNASLSFSPPVVASGLISQAYYVCNECLKQTAPHEIDYWQISPQGNFIRLTDEGPRPETR